MSVPAGTVVAKDLAARGPGILVRSWPLALAASLLLTGILYWPIGGPLVRVWNTDANFSHGVLIPLLAAYLVWRRRQDLRAVPRRPSALGLGLIAASLGVFMVADLAGEAHAMRLSLLVTMGGLVLTFWGAQALRLLLTPIAFLGFMFPYPYVLYFWLAQPLITLTAWASGLLLYQAGIPVHREGTMLVLPQITLEVVESCSGLRSLIALMPLGVLLACVGFTRLGPRIVIVAAVVPVSIVANLIRVTQIGMIAYQQGADATGISIHESANWWTLIIGTALLLAVAGILQWIDRRSSAGSAS